MSEASQPNETSMSVYSQAGVNVTHLCRESVATTTAASASAAATAAATAATAAASSVSPDLNNTGYNHHGDKPKFTPRAVIH